jgi:hypothetical protein
MKIFLTTILFCLNFSLFAQKINWIPFDWVGDSVSGKYFDKLAITIPVSIENLPHKFNMQLDLGAVNTNFYGNSLKPYLDKYSSLQSKLDTTLTFRMQSQTNYMFRDVNLILGKVSFGKRNIGHFKNFGDVVSKDSIFTDSEKNIGTIAPDLFANQILIIDYKNKRICVVNKLPAQFTQASFQKFKIKEGRIKIPIVINDKEEDVMFDTGSSIFSLITTKENAQKISNKNISDSLKISSWGDYYMVYGEKTIRTIKYGKMVLQPTLVYYDEQKGSEKFYSEEKIWGITGNAYFLDKIVIIDYKNQLFGIK